MIRWIYVLVLFSPPLFMYFWNYYETDRIHETRSRKLSIKESWTIQFSFLGNFLNPFPVLYQAYVWCETREKFGQFWRKIKWLFFLIFIKKKMNLLILRQFFVDYCFVPTRGIGKVWNYDWNSYIIFWIKTKRLIFFSLLSSLFNKLWFLIINFLLFWFISSIQINNLQNLMQNWQKKRKKSLSLILPR